MGKRTVAAGFLPLPDDDHIITVGGRRRETDASFWNGRIARAKSSKSLVARGLGIREAATRQAWRLMRWVDGDKATVSRWISN
jgi:hypothetical protein